MLMSRQSVEAEKMEAAEEPSPSTAADAARRIELQHAAPGRSWRIAAIEGGVELQRALARLGLRPGLCIEVAQHTRCGPVVVAGGLKLALGEDAARHLLVEPCGQSPA